MSQKFFKGQQKQERHSISRQLRNNLDPVEVKQLPQISVLPSTLESQPGNEPVERVSAYFDKKDFLKTFAQEFEDIQPSARLMSARSGRSQKGGQSRRGSPASRNQNLQVSEQKAKISVKKENNQRNKTVSPSIVSRNTSMITTTNKTFKTKSSSISTVEVLSKQIKNQTL